MFFSTNWNRPWTSLNLSRSQEKINNCWLEWGELYFRERTILLSNMATWRMSSQVNNRHWYYNLHIPVSHPLFSRTPQNILLLVGNPDRQFERGKLSETVVMSTSIDIEMNITEVVINIYERRIWRPYSFNHVVKSAFLLTVPTVIYGSNLFI